MVPHVGLHLTEQDRRAANLAGKMVDPRRPDLYANVEPGRGEPSRTGRESLLPELLPDAVVRDGTGRHGEHFRSKKP